MKCHSILSQFRENKILSYRYNARIRLRWRKSIRRSHKKSLIANKSVATLIDFIIQFRQTRQPHLHIPLWVPQTMFVKFQINKIKHMIFHAIHFKLPVIIRKWSHFVYWNSCCLHGHQCAIYDFDGDTDKTPRILCTHTKHTAQLLTTLINANGVEHVLKHLNTHDGKWFYIYSSQHCYMKCV